MGQRDGLVYYAGKFVPRLHAACDPQLAPEPPRCTIHERSEPVPPPPLEPAEAIADRVRASGQVVTIEHVCKVALSAATERHGRCAETQRMDWCCKLLVRLFGSTPADQFGPNALRAARRDMLVQIHGPHDLVLSRKEINRRIGVVLRIFKVAASFELIPTSVHEGLRCLDPLRRGRTGARELPPILPVPRDVFEATLPWCSPTIRLMLQTQAATGCRSGELVGMRVCDVDRSALPWRFCPAKHKNAWRGAVREIDFGPRIRELLGPLFDGREPSAFVFCPRDEMARWAVEKRALRKSPVQPSQVARGKRNAGHYGGRPPGKKYTVESYSRAVARACARAGVPHWRPYQLRHAHLARIRDLHGIEAAQAVGGHASLAATQLYTHANLKRARELAEEMG